MAKVTGIAIESAQTAVTGGNEEVHHAHQAADSARRGHGSPLQ
jgi:hypothetical protein